MFSLLPIVISAPTYLKHANFPQCHLSYGRIIFGFKELLDGHVLSGLTMSASHNQSIWTLAHHRYDIILFHLWRVNCTHLQTPFYCLHQYCANVTTQSLNIQCKHTRNWMFRVVYKWRWLIQPENVHKSEQLKYFAANFADICVIYKFVFLYALQNSLTNIVQGFDIKHGALSASIKRLHIAQVTIARQICIPIYRASRTAIKSKKGKMCIFGLTKPLILWANRYFNKTNSCWRQQQRLNIIFFL